MSSSANLHAPTDAAARKALPLCTGVLDYFPDALLAVAEVSRVGNDQHNPGQPLHWAKEKSTDEADSLLRHMVDRGKRDKDGCRHSAKVAWRALALLQREIEAERQAPRHKIYFEDSVCSARKFVRTGEVRVPKVGEWYVVGSDSTGSNHEAGLALCRQPDNCYPRGVRDILREVTYEGK